MACRSVAQTNSHPNDIVLVHIIPWGVPKRHIFHHARAPEGGKGIKLLLLGSNPCLLTHMRDIRVRERDSSTER
eukprot:352791-Chlamydomonas_euryale.AAC.7